MVRKFVLGFLASVVALLALFFAAVFWPTHSAPLPTGPDDRLLVDVRVIDVEVGTVGNTTRVRIVDGTIAQIDSSLIAQPGEAVFYGKGAYILPGFWDMHMHSFQLSPQLHLPLFVANGVTGVRDMMDCPSPSDALIACVGDKRRWTRAAAAGQMASPRFVNVASFYFNDPKMSARSAVDTAAIYGARGIDAIKVYDRLSRETYFALANQAQESGKPLVGHLPKAISLDEAISAGQRSFEHGHILIRHCMQDARGWREGRLDKLNPTSAMEKSLRQQDARVCAKAIETLRETDVWLVPTHVTREEDARAADPAFVTDPRLDYLDPLSRFAFNDDLSATSSRYPGKRGEVALQGYFDLGLRRTGEAHRGGVKILVGTDTAIGGFRYHDELQHLVQAGMTPAEVLRSATIEAARYANLESRYGSVKVGKAADLVLLDGNPLADIAHTRRIRAVLLGGRLYDQNGLDQLLSFTMHEAHMWSNWAKLIWGFATSDVSSEL